ncbi:M48 family metalloprotease [Pseudomonadota bacterium]
MIRGWWQFGLLAGLIAVSTACSVNPVSGKRDFVMMSEDEEIHLGSESHADIIREYGLYDAPELQAYVQQIGEALAEKSHRGGLAFKFTVLDSTQVNAFALPGGYIYITRGLLAYLNSEAELAAVLGHEIGHVTARHGVRQVSAAKATSLGLSIGSILVPELQNSLVSNLLNTLSTAMIRGYGREHELEADRLGAEYLARSGYSPQAMIKVIGVLKNQELFDKQLAKEEGRKPRAYHGVFASHPENDTRLQRVVEAAEQFKASGANRLVREPFLEKLEGMVFGDSEGEGVRRGSQFFHAGLNTGLDFPNGWSVENGANSVLGMPKDRAAKLVMNMEKIDQRMTPEAFTYAHLKVDTLDNDKEIRGEGLEGYTGVTDIKTALGMRRARIAVIYLGGKAYVFIGYAQRKGEFVNYDADFYRTISSFRTLSKSEQSLARALRLKLHKVTASQDMGELAAVSVIPHHAEEQLRLLNDLYPDGELSAGRTIKVVQ